MIRFRLVTSIIGYLSMGYVCFMFIPLVVSLIKQEQDSSIAFIVTIAISFILGRLAILSDKKAEMDELNRMESLAVVVFGWLILALIGSIPYMFFDFSFIDSLFESMSGFTTTGSTILSDFGRRYAVLLFKYTVKICNIIKPDTIRNGNNGIRQTDLRQDPRKQLQNDLAGKTGAASEQTPQSPEEFT